MEPRRQAFSLRRADSTGSVVTIEGTFSVSWASHAQLSASSWVQFCRHCATVSRVSLLIRPCAGPSVVEGGPAANVRTPIHAARIPRTIALQDAPVEGDLTVVLIL